MHFPDIVLHDLDQVLQVHPQLFELAKYNKLDLTKNYLGLSVVHTMEIDSETSLNAGEIAEIMEQIQKGNVEILFI